MAGPPPPGPSPLKERLSGCAPNGLLIVLLLVAIGAAVVYATLESPENPRVGPAPEQVAPTDPAAPLRRP